MQALITLAVAAVDGLGFREAALDILAARVPFDAALFHALSPRVPLSTAAIRGLDVDELARSMSQWDQWAVELGRFRDVGIAQRGVATDSDVLPRRGGSRLVFERAFGARRVRCAAFVHLMVRGRIVAVVVLVRFRDRPFDAQEVAFLRRVAPALAVGDELHQLLDQTRRASVPTRLRCLDQRLTPHQREVVEYVALGHTNRAIAVALGRSANTVRNQLAEVMRRLGASNRADVVRLAVVR